MANFSTIEQVFDKKPIWAKTRVVHLVKQKYLQWNSGIGPPYEMYNLDGAGTSPGKHVEYNPRAHWQYMSVANYLDLFPGIDRRDTRNRLHHCLVCGLLVPAEERTLKYSKTWYNIGPPCNLCIGKDVS